MANISALDISDELYLRPYGQGLVIFQPEKLKKQFVSHDESQFRIKELFQLPFNVYCMNTAGEMIKPNEMTAINAGYSSVCECVGKTVFDVVEYNNALQVRNTDLTVLRSQKQLFSTDKFYLTSTETMLEYLTIKFPILNLENISIGIFGISILLHQKYLLADTLNLLMQTGLLSSPVSKLSPLWNFLDSSHKTICGISLTEQEKRCLSLIMKGKTSKQIGSALGLSYRTVEHYLEKIKIKFNVNSKSELIDKVFTS